GPLAEPFGRRALLLTAAAMFVAGALLAATAPAIWVLTAARIVLGAAIGVAGMMAPLYISESAPADRRGLLVSGYQLAITLGILGAYLVDYAVDTWRLMFAAGVVPAAALGVGIYWLSDTPRWLMSRRRTAEAKAAIARIREVPEADPVVTRELAEI